MPRGETGELLSRGYIVMLGYYWRFVDSFPMTVTGKVQKYLMREEAITDLRLETAAGVRTA